MDLRALPETRLEASRNRISGSDPAQFLAARGLGGIILWNQLLPAARRADRPARAARRAGVERAAGDAALSAQPAFPVQYAELDLHSGAVEADRAGECHACTAVIVPALHAG